jgi:hypothetical protein
MRAGFSLTRALGVAIAVPALIALAACATSREQSPESPASARAADPQVTSTAAAEPAYQPQGGASSSIDQVLADLQRAEGELGVAIEALSASQGRKSPAGMPVPGGTSDAAVPRSAQQAPATSPMRPGETELSSDPCFSACRALASMTRAAAHLCDLAGNADPRCDSAQSRLRSARERVEGSCACGPPG